MFVYDLKNYLKNKVQESYWFLSLLRICAICNKQFERQIEIYLSIISLYDPLRTPFANHGDLFRPKALW